MFLVPQLQSLYGKFYLLLDSPPQSVRLLLNLFTTVRLNSVLLDVVLALQEFVLPVWLVSPLMLTQIHASYVLQDVLNVTP